MANFTHLEPSFNLVEDGLDTYDFTVDFGSVINLKRFVLNYHYNVTLNHYHLYVQYSFDGVNYSTISSTNLGATINTHLSNEINTDTNTQFLYIRFLSVSTGVSVFTANEVYVQATDDLIPDSVDVQTNHESVDVGLPSWQGYTIADYYLDIVFPYIVTQVDGGDGGGGDITDPTHTHIISGNVKKLGLPFEANVVAVSLGLEPEVVGSGVSDIVTGNYSIDIYPHTDEVLIYVAPEYGREFSSFLPVSAGTVFHPTIPNKYVYVAQNDGIFGGEEPTWNITGDTTSGDVVMTPVPLHRPLMNGFIKPVITPI